MKNLLKVILIVFVALSATSCLTTMAVAASSSQKAMERGKYFGDDNAKMVLKTFQRISTYAALATTGSGDVACVIADFGEYYDGLSLEGRFIKKGTYSYTTPNGTNKTVLVYLYRPDRKRLERYTEEFLKKKEPVVVDVPVFRSI